MKAKPVEKRSAQEYEVVPIDAVQPHPKNPRQGDIGCIVQSIQRNGFQGALLVQRSTSHILAGNHRWRAAHACGIEAIPVLWADVDDETALRILIADNRTSDLATWDMPALAELLQSVISESGSLEGTGYDGDDLDAIIADLGNGVLDTSGPQEPDGAPREPRSHTCPSCGHEFRD